MLREDQNFCKRRYEQGMMSVINVYTEECLKFLRNMY